jgi:hypothetical protein
MYEEKHFESWNDLKFFLSSLDSNWIYRGQKDFNWKLESAIDRVKFKTEFKNQKYLFEKFYIRDLKRNPHLYNKQFSVHSDFQTLALLQHYGIPTRLLDFSMSPYVASFFAVIDSEEDSSIYAINYFELLSSTVHLFRLKYDDDSPEITKFKNGIGISDDELFKELVLSNKQRKFIEIVQPFFLFDRMIQQDGVFLCQGNINCSFEENLSANHEILQGLKDNNPYYKIKIKHEWKDEIIRDLQKMNISSASLFPGIEGYLKSLKNNFEIMIKDRGKSIIQEEE